MAFIKDCSKQYAHKYSECLLLVESYRDKAGKPRHRVLANLSKLPKGLAEVIISKVKGKTMVALEDLKTVDNRSLGEVTILKRLCEQLGMVKILQRQLGEVSSKLVLAMVINRVCKPKSRYGLRDWLQATFLPNLLRIPVKKCHHNYLYEALKVLQQKQTVIENELWEENKSDEKLTLMLYDITSTYLEGFENELAAFGYNRDRKKGKKQLVVGLVTTKEGLPVSVEVFKGNTADKTTLVNKVRDVQKRFAAEEVVYVFDRGMKDEPKLETLRAENMSYITALSRGEIRKLVENNQKIQLGFFDERGLAEYTIGERRYIVCRSDQKDRNRRKRELLLQKTEEKLKMVKRNVDHGRWKKERVIAARTERWLSKWKMKKYFEIKIKEGFFSYQKKQDVLEQVEEIDGVYLLETNVSQEKLADEEVRTGYKNLAKVESSFRVIKSVLNIRPVFHRKEDTTRGHVFVCFLALYLRRELELRLQPLLKKATFDHLLTQLKEIRQCRLKAGKHQTTIVDELNPEQKQLLKTLGMRVFPIRPAKLRPPS